MHVYLIKNTVNGKLYVGKANDPKTRWCQHKSAGRQSASFSTMCNALVRAMRKYGVEVFTFEILGQYASEAEAYEAERHWIAALNSTTAGWGYNLNGGGEGGYQPTPETLDKFRTTMRNTKRPSAECTVCRAPFQPSLFGEATCGQACREEAARLRRLRRDRLYRKMHREEHNTFTSKWKRDKYADDPAYRQRVLDRNRVRANARPDQVRQRNRQQYLNNRERVLQKKRERIGNDPDAYRARKRDWARAARERHKAAVSTDKVGSPPCSLAEAKCHRRLRQGDEFLDPETQHRWRVTDVGPRTFAAVDLNVEGPEKWFRRIVPSLDVGI